MRKQLSKSEIKELNKRLSGFNIILDKKAKIELIENKFIYINNQLRFFFYEDKIVPVLKLLLEKDLLRTVIVDMGAVKFIVSGSDIMRPGIREIDPDIHKGDIVKVIDEKNHKPLCIAEALFNGDEIKKMMSGRVLKNIHFVGDTIWTNC